MVDPQRPDPAEQATRIESPQEPQTGGASEISDRLAKHTPQAEETLDFVDATTGQPQSSETPQLVQFGDYQILKQIGRGGMGAVFLANQRSLDRRVALKTILAGRLADEEAVARFYQEARSAARFDHPNIVPVFEVGNLQGHHFYSMAFVQGNSLDKQIQEKPMPPRYAAQLASKIASAIEYAHQRGVIHRDIKPANVLIDEHGEPKITDFGLAKTIGGDSQLTAAGQVLGTPSYMSWEQAVGRIEQIDQRTDVYSVGAVLYAMLTSRPPFQADNPLDTLQLVRTADPLSPRRQNPKIPRDLETICLKCLEKKPERRYQTAAQLEDDLTRFLDGHPILARPLGPLGRSVKWTKRHPVLAASAVVVFLSLAGGAALASYFAVMANAALADMHRQYQRAESALAETRHTIDRYVDVVEQSELLREERFQPLLRQLLQHALAHYKRFIAEHEHDFQVKAELAQAVSRVALINQRSGDAFQAVVAYQQAIDLLSRLNETGQGGAPLRVELAGALSNLALMYREIGNLALAEKTSRQALSIYRDLADEFPDDDHHLNLVATSLLNVGGIEHDFGRHQQAIDHFEQALQTVNSILSRGGNPVDLATKALILRDLAFVHQQIGNADQSVALLGDAIEIRHQLAENSNDPNVLHQLATIYTDAGRLHASIGMPDALSHQHRALEILSQLVDNHPNTHVFRSDLGICQLEIGRGYYETGEWNASEKALTAAVDAFETLTAWSPDNHLYQFDLAKSWLQLGLLMRVRNELDAARRNYERAIEKAKSLSPRDDSRFEIQSFLAKAHTNLGNLHAQQQQATQAAEHFQHSITLLEELVRQRSQVIDDASTLGATYINFAMLAQQIGQLPAAVERFDKAITILQQTQQRDPANVLLRTFLHVGYAGRAATLQELGKPLSAAEDWEAALKWDDGSNRAVTLVQFAQSLLDADLPARAATSIAQLVEGQPPPAAEYYFAAACIYAQCYHREDQAGVQQAADTQRAIGYLNNAISCLRQAKAMDFFQESAARARLDTDPRLDSIRAQAQYQQFVRSLADQ